MNNLVGALLPLEHGEKIEFRTDDRGYAVQTSEVVCRKWALQAVGAVLEPATLDLAEVKASDAGTCECTVLADIALGLTITGAVASGEQLPLAELTLVAIGQVMGEVAIEADGTFELRPLPANFGGRVPDLSVELQVRDGNHHVLMADGQSGQAEPLRVNWGDKGVLVSVTALRWEERKIRVIAEDTGTALPEFKVAWVEQSDRSISTRAVTVESFSSPNGICTLKCIAGRPYYLNVIPVDAGYLPSGQLSIPRDAKEVIVRCRRPEICVIELPELVNAGGGVKVELLAAASVNGSATNEVLPGCDVNNLIVGALGGILVPRFGLREATGPAHVELNGEPGTLAVVRISGPRSEVSISEPMMVPFRVRAAHGPGGWTFARQ